MPSQRRRKPALSGGGVEALVQAAELLQRLEIVGEQAERGDLAAPHAVENFGRGGVAPETVHQLCHELALRAGHLDAFDEVALREEEDDQHRNDE